MTEASPVSRIMAALMVAGMSAMPARPDEWKPRRPGTFAAEARALEVEKVMRGSTDGFFSLRRLYSEPPTWVEAQEAKKGRPIMNLARHFLRAFLGVPR